MPRPVTGPVTAALAADHVAFLVFVEMDFTSGFVRVCNAGYSFPWNGFSWIGTGALGSIDVITEDVSQQAHGLGLSLSGIPPEYISIALNSGYKGRPCKLWVAPLDSEFAVITSPVQIFTGRLDTMDIELGETATITVNAESRHLDQNRPRIRRYTHEDQILEFPGDTGFEFVSQAASKEIVWGRA